MSGTDQDGTTETAARVRELSARREERIADRELDAMVSEFYAEEARLLPADRPVVHGREEIREFWRGAPEEGLISLELDPVEVDGSGELAYEIGTFLRTVRPRHGALLRIEGKYLTLYRRQEDGSLKAIAEIYNRDESR